MKVVLYRMDILPAGARKLGWWKKEFEINDSDDIVNFMGYHCSDSQWGQIYQTDASDDPALIAQVQEILDAYVTRAAGETIDFLHEIVLRGLELDEKREREGAA